MPNLIVERGREKGTSFELKTDAPCVAGRDPASVQIVLSDPASSRRHFQVAAKGGKWYLTDLGSKNSTYLNSERVSKEMELSNGDNIQVGETVLSFIDESKSDTSAAQGLNGKEIGGYKILDRLGRGGMGTVFKAKQISLNRVIALKVLASKFARDPKFVEKFQSEARAAGQLNHPNVVQVFDVGQLGGLHFFSMELMEGGCVQDLLSAAPEGRLTWQEAMPLIIDAARGLVFAEKRGIIHRDIKPDNLMLTSEQRVKIGDLGLAKKAEDGDGDKQIFGTPHFIAPEQAQGKEITHAADLYALGATFYRMVTGKTPFSGENVKDILKKQINDPHQPVREIVSDFPEDLAAIIDKLMAKKVENRYQSATKLVEDLEAFQLAHQIELSGARKMNKPLMIGLTVLLLAAVGTGIHFYLKPAEKIKGDTVYVEDEAAREAARKAAEEAKKAEIQLLVSNAKDARQEVELDDAKLGKVSLENKAAFLQIAERYDALKGKFSDERLAATIKPGLDRAQEIRDTLDRLAKEKADADARSAQWWTGAQSKLDELEKAKKWPEAARLAKSWLTDDEGKKHADDLNKIEAREVDLAQKDLDETVRKAQELKAGDDVESAIKLLDGWADALEASNKPPMEKFTALVQQARDAAHGASDSYRIALQTQIDQDKLVYVDAVRSLHQGGSGLGKVFDLQFDAAAGDVETAAAALKTYPYKERAARLVARLHAAQAAWAAWVELLGDGKLYTAEDEIKGLPDVKPTYRAKLKSDEKPTVERFTVRMTGPGGTETKTFHFADFSREDLWTTLVAPKLDKLPGDVAAGLAWLFVWLGHDDAAQPLLDRATAAGAKFDGDDETALRREIATVKAYDEIRKIQGGEPAVVVAAVEAWRKNIEAVTTDSFVLLDGRDKKDAQFRVLPADVVDEFMKNLGKKKQ